METITEMQDADDMYMLEAAKIRGIVMNALTILERTIDTYISHHFSDTTEKRQELMCNVFATKYITYENKRLIFNKLTEEHHKEYKDKNLPNFHAELNRFGKHRNDLAHCVVDASMEAVNLFMSTKQVTFLRYMNSVDPEIYTEDSAKKIAKSIYAFVEPVAAIINFSVKL